VNVIALDAPLAVVMTTCAEGALDAGTVTVQVL
jgi:hypothetical protein